MTYQDLHQALTGLLNQGLGGLEIRGWQKPAPVLPLNSLGVKYTVMELLRAINNATGLVSSNPVLDTAGREMNLIAQARDHVLLAQAMPERCPGCSQG